MTKESAPRGDSTAWENPDSGGSPVPRVDHFVVVVLIASKPIKKIQGKPRKKETVTFSLGKKPMKRPSTILVGCGCPRTLGENIFCAAD